jgi:hypothetical protein
MCPARELPLDEASDKELHMQTTESELTLTTRAYLSNPKKEYKELMQKFCASQAMLDFRKH